VQKVVAGSPEVTYDYYYDADWRLLEVRKDSDPDPYEQFVWGQRYIDAPVLRWRDADGQSANGLEETLYYCQDANMSTTALVDTSGTVVERVLYDPYGEPTFYDQSWQNPSSTSAYANEVLFAGYRYDSETGLYHVRHRMYHPPLGRWLQRDPAGYKDALSTYEYARSRPAVALDPMGQWIIISRDLEKPWMEACAQSGDTWKGIAQMQRLERHIADHMHWARHKENGFPAFEDQPQPGRRYLIANPYCPSGRWRSGAAVLDFEGGYLAVYMTFGGEFKCDDNNRAAVVVVQGKGDDLLFYGFNVSLVNLRVTASDAYCLKDMNGRAKWWLVGAGSVGGISRLSIWKEGGGVHYLSFSIGFTLGTPVDLMGGNASLGAAPQEEGWY